MACQHQVARLVASLQCTTHVPVYLTWLAPRAAQMSAH